MKNNLTNILCVLALLMLPVLTGLNSFQEENQSQQQSSPRFEAIDIYIDSGDVPLAAYQLEFKAVKGSVKIVGISNGEHEAYADEPPYYDTAAMQQNLVIIAAFSLNKTANLPTAKTRITTISLMIEGDIEPEYKLQLTAAASVEGKRINATITYESGNES